MLISRIQAADASIPSDLGRDVSTVQALQRKHQVTLVTFVGNSLRFSNFSNSLRFSNFSNSLRFSNFSNSLRFSNFNNYLRFTFSQNFSN